MICHKALQSANNCNQYGFTVKRRLQTRRTVCLFVEFPVLGRRGLRRKLSLILSASPSDCTLFFATNTPILQTDCHRRKPVSGGNRVAQLLRIRKSQHTQNAECAVRSTKIAGVNGNHQIAFQNSGVPSINQLVACNSIL